MGAGRRGYELKGLFFGRTVRPFHLAVALATGSLAVANSPLVSRPITPGASAHLLVLFLVAVGMVSATLLTAGWWLRHNSLAEWGLLLAAGVWAARAVYVLSAGTGLLGYVYVPLSVSVVSSLISMAWSIGAAGAYLLERYDHVLLELNPDE